MPTKRSSTDIANSLRNLLPALQQKYGVEKIGIFGSYIRKEQRAGSDLDLLVTFTDPPGLFSYIELENYLSDNLGIQVDLVMEDALKPTIKQNILAEVQYV